MGLYAVYRVVSCLGKDEYELHAFSRDLNEIHHMFSRGPDVKWFFHDQNCNYTFCQADFHIEDRSDVYQLPQLLH